MKNTVKKIKKVLIDITSMLRGNRELSLSFQTLSPLDSLYAIIYSLQTLLGFNRLNAEREKFLKKVKLQYDYKAAFLFGSARSALYTILSSLNYGPKSEVILTGFTCDVVPNAVIQAGLMPVYADIDLSNYCMSPKSVMECITKNTKVLVIQHTFGIPADVDALLKIAQKHSLYVIEDCAVSLGTKYKESLTGTFGDAAIFSFELTKTITACRGGMLIINSLKDEVIAKVAKYYIEEIPEQKNIYKAMLLLQLGISGLLYHPRILPVGKYLVAGLFKIKLFDYSISKEEKLAQKPQNYLHKLSHEQAAVLSRQWDRLPSIVSKSRANVEYYMHELEYLLNKEFIDYVKKCDINMVRFPLLLSERERIILSCNRLKVEIGLWFTAPLSSDRTNQELFYYKKGQCPTSEGICSTIINLPVHCRLSKDDRNITVKEVKNNA